ncbi:MAG: hypothetical protein WDA60_09980 [Acidimicrobiia bacterium]
MGRESYEKRQREKKRQERAAEKRQKREERGDEVEGEEAPDADALMEQFRILSEQRAAGIVDAETYEAERLVIFEQLGLADQHNS